MCQQYLYTQTILVYICYDVCNFPILCYAVVTCEIKCFKIIFGFRRRPSEIIFAEIISTLFERLIAAHEYFPACSLSLK